MPSNLDHGLADDEFSKIEAKLALIRTAATAPPDAPESWFKRTFAPAAPSSRPREIDAALVDVVRDTVAVLRERVATHLARFGQIEQDVAGLRSVLASVRELQERSAATETMLAQFRQEQSEVRDRLAAITEQLAQSRQEQSEVRDRLAAITEQLAQSRQEQSEVRDRLATIAQELATMGQELAQSGPEQSEVRNRLAAFVQQMAQSEQEQSGKIKQLVAGQGDLANEFRERIQQLLEEQRVCIRQISLKTSEEAVLADRARRATEQRLEEIARRLPEHPA